MSGALDFYLAAGCDVVGAADGWVRLRNAGNTFIVARGPVLPGTPVPEIPELVTADLAETCGRLKALGVEPGTVTRSPEAPGGRISVRDPERHTVVVRQADAVGLPAASRRAMS